VVRLVDGSWVATILAITMGIRSLATIISPAIGAPLYDAGGFTMPYLVFGILFIIFGFLQYGLRQSCADDLVASSEESATISSILRVPMVWVVVAVLFFFTFIMFLLDPLYARWLSAHPYELSTEEIGFFACFLPLGMTVGMFLGSVLLRWIPKATAQLIVGVIISVCGLLMLGPAPGIAESSELFIAAACVAGFGFGLSMAVCPSFLMRILLGQGMNKKEISGALGAVLFLVLMIGALFGPMVGYILEEAVGDFQVLMLVLAIFVALVYIPCAILLIRYESKESSGPPPEVKKSEGFAAPLLNGLRTVTPNVLPLSLGSIGLGSTWMTVTDFPYFHDDTFGEVIFLFALVTCILLQLAYVAKMVLSTAAANKLDYLGAIPAFSAGSMAHMFICKFISHYHGWGAYVGGILWFIAVAEFFVHMAFFLMSPPIKAFFLCTEYISSDSEKEPQDTSGTLPGSFQAQEPQGPSLRTRLESLWRASNASWFVPLAGIAAATISGTTALDYGNHHGGPHSPTDDDGVQYWGSWRNVILWLLLILGFFWTIVLTPMIASRTVVSGDLFSDPRSLILMAPWALCTAGYFSFESATSSVARAFGLTFMIITLLFIVLGYVGYPSLMDPRKPFDSRYASLTFPMVTAAASLCNYALWLTPSGSTSEGELEAWRILGLIQLSMATLTVGYVLVRFCMDGLASVCK